MFKRTNFLLKNIIRALNVAEKPSVARTVTDILSKKNYQPLESLSQYNPVFEFNFKINDKEHLMKFTSVTGHLMNIDFTKENKIWNKEKIKDLFNAEMVKFITDKNTYIEKNLIKYGKLSDILILWLDCDREGENISFEVLDVVKKANPKIKIYRAKFSALTEKDITYSISNLIEPNQNVSNGVELRQKIDLLIGSSFTRLQTLSFQNILPIKAINIHNFKKNGNDLQNKQKFFKQNNIISYGPCQFPTLNFIVERAEKIGNFVKENFFSLELLIKKEYSGKIYEVKFNWERDRLFDKDVVTSLLEKVEASKSGAKITKVKETPKTKYRPIPLNTIEFQKLATKKLKISSHKAMEIAEKLYQQGFISYPRTETQKYSPNQIPYLKKTVSDLGKSDYSIWSAYAKNLANNFKRPLDGKLDDKSHPPIHPVKLPPIHALSEFESKIYQMIVLHFLATVSQDAKGNEVFVELTAGGETFSAKGMTLTEKGYLEIYTYDSWAEIFIPPFKEGKVFKIEAKMNSKKKVNELEDNKKLIETNLNSALLSINKGTTTPPNYLTEAELITLMDKYKIGTDSTIHEHIKHVQERGYTFQSKSNFIPTSAGYILIKAYKKIGVELYKPFLRAAMEKEISEVCEGKKDGEVVFKSMKKEMKKIFDNVYRKIPIMEEHIQAYANSIAGTSLKPTNKLEEKVYNEQNIEEKNQNKNSEKNGLEITNKEINITCPMCQKCKLILRSNKINGYFFIGCTGYPVCKFSHSIDNPKSIDKIDEKCETCNSNLYNFEFNKNQNEVRCLSSCLNDELRESINDKKKQSTGKSKTTWGKKTTNVHSKIRQIIRKPKNEIEEKDPENSKYKTTKRKKTNSDNSGNFLV